MKSAKSKKTALAKAVDFLARQDHSTAKLREKLMRLRYDKTDIDVAIEKLIAKGYLNDRAVCERQFHYLYAENRASVRRIGAKLRERGFDEEDIASCVPFDTEEREITVARRLIEQKYRHTAAKEVDKAKESEKMKAFLYRQGFDGDVCHKVVEDFMSYCESEQED